MRAGCEKEMVKSLVAAVGASAVFRIPQEAVKIRKLIKDVGKQLY